MKNSLVYRNELLKKEGSELLCHAPKFPAIELNYKINPALEVVFSPDPLSGWPSSDIYLMNEGNVNSDVRKFLEGLNKPLQLEVCGNYDDDVVLDTMMFRDDSLDDYNQRVETLLSEADFENVPDN